jgi:hypothetical protein
MTDERVDPSLQSRLPHKRTERQRSFHGTVTEKSQRPASLPHPLSSGAAMIDLQGDGGQQVLELWIPEVSGVRSVARRQHHVRDTEKRYRNMTSALKAAVVALTLTTACLAQESFVTVSNKQKQKWPAQEVDKIYLSACSAVQKEFGGNHAVGPRLALVLGADRNVVDFDKKQISLMKWNRDLFAQGVVVLAFEDLMTEQQRVTIARRALNWTDATIDVAQIGR